MDEIFGIDAAYPRTGENWLRLIVQREEVSRYFEQQVFSKKSLFEKAYQIIYSLQIFASMPGTPSPESAKSLLRREI